MKIQKCKRLLASILLSSVFLSQLQAQPIISLANESTSVENTHIIEILDENVITSFEKIETTYYEYEHKPWLEVVRDDLPSQLTVSLGGEYLLDFSGNPVFENSISKTIPVHWECLQDYNQYLGTYEFSPVADGYELFPCIEIPVITVHIENENSGRTSSTCINATTGISTYDGVRYIGAYDATYNTFSSDSPFSNHSVMLVGWDDTFPKEYFPLRKKTDYDGACLVRNSWGYNDYGLDGYFWIPYEEPSFINDDFVCAFEADHECYDNVYSYDGSPIMSKQFVEWSDEEIDDATLYTDSKGKTKYGFSYPLVAAEMDQPVSLFIKDENSSSNELYYALENGNLFNQTGYKTSILNYLSSIEKNEIPEADRVKNITRAMAFYGYYSKAYFNPDKTFDMDQYLNHVFNDTDYSEYLNEVNNVNADNLKTYSSVCSTGEQSSGISYYGTSLLLKSGTTIRHYFNIDEDKSVDNFTFTCNGVTLTPTIKNDLCYIDIENISAVDYNKAFVVNVNGLELRYSVYSYLYNVLRRSSSDPNLANIAKSMYLFGESSRNYYNN